MGGRGSDRQEAAAPAAPVAAPPPTIPLPGWERWGWVAVRLVAGWYWLDHGSRALTTAAGVPAQVLAAGETLAGIAVLLGFFTGAAALGLVVAGALALVAGDLAVALPLAAAASLVPAWRRAGAIGFDHWLLTRWDGRRGRTLANGRSVRVG